MKKIFKYTIYDLGRSKWLYFYFGFYLAAGFMMLFLNNNLHTGMVNLMNLVIVLSPLICTILGVIHNYNSRDFVELLLSQPIKRHEIFLGQYFGLSVALSAALATGILIPFIFYGLLKSSEIWNLLSLVISGILLNFIFTGISLLVGILSENKIMGFGIAIFIWLFTAVIYDGLFLLSLFIFNNYPLEKFTIFASILNPIDLARIHIILNLDNSAMMGYTGAVFSKFFGSFTGMLISLGVNVLWIGSITFFIKKAGDKKDF
jgi:Cu-processing system permease protein